MTLPSLPSPSLSSPSQSSVLCPSSSSSPSPSSLSSSSSSSASPASRYICKNADLRAPVAFLPSPAAFAGPASCSLKTRPAICCGITCQIDIVPEMPLNCRSPMSLHTMPEFLSSRNVRAPSYARELMRI
eukprot:Amastigsp_a342151_11.p5 type:complete len:130 gc:universal Amastigsp_a342151_11:2833-2444(-)